MANGTNSSGLNQGGKKLQYNESNKFFGAVHRTSGKYFIPEKLVSDDGKSIIVITNNVKTIKGNPVLITGNNQAVYLKDFNIAGVSLKSDGKYVGDFVAVKLNEKYFKPYKFKNNFEEFSFDKNNSFKDLLETAKSQQKENNEISPFTVQISPGSGGIRKLKSGELIGY